MGKGGNGVWYPVLLILATNFHWSISGDGEWKYEERAKGRRCGSIVRSKDANGETDVSMTVTIIHWN